MTATASLRSFDRSSVLPLTQILSKITIRQKRKEKEKEKKERETEKERERRDR